MRKIVRSIINSLLSEMAYSRYDKNDDILQKDVLDALKIKLGFKRFTRIGSGRFGVAFKISNNKVLKITKDLKEYEYAKIIEGVKNRHIADVYKSFHFKNNNEDEYYNKYACILKEFCNVDESYFDNIIDDFLEHTGKEMSLSYVSSEFLSGDIDKMTLDALFERYKNNGGAQIEWMRQWYDMLMELKSKRIYIKDFNGSNVGTKQSTGELCIIELGLGYWDWDIIKFQDSDKIEINETSEFPKMDSMFSKYKLRYPKTNTFIKVNINKLLDRHKKDEPSYAFDTKETSNYPSRVDKAKDFWINFSNDQRYINTKTNERTNWGKVDFEAPYVLINNGKLGFSDGRHRTIAMKELGYDDIIIEIPKSQIQLFNDLI
jgi:hypothetical protein